MSDKPSKIRKIKHQQGGTSVTLERRWWTVPDGSIHQHLFQLAKRIREDQRERLNDDAHHARLYSNKEYQNLSLALYGSYEPKVNRRRLKWNVVKANVDTGAAKIAKNRPRPLFMTEKGNFRQQRKAENLTQYLDGFFDSEEVYPKGVNAFFRGAVYGTGFLHAYSNGEKVCVESVLPSEIMVDEMDGIYGEPRCFYRMKYIQRDELIERFEDKDGSHAKIQAAGGMTEHNSRSETAKDMVLVVEGWHLPTSTESKDGKHAIVIDGCTLFQEEWNKPYFPFAAFRWSEPLAGFFGSGIPQEIEGTQIEINRVLTRTSDAHELVAIPRVLVHDQTKVKTITNETGSFVRWNGPEKPEWITPTGMQPETYKYLGMLWDKSFEQTGISQMSAASKKPAGLDAAVAIREFNDIETERFVLVGQNYEKMFLDLARIIIDLSRELDAHLKKEGKKGLAIYAKNRDFLKQIKWSEVDLEAEKYVMRSFPTSLLPSQPPAKFQRVEELVKGGYIPQDEAMELLDFPDLRAYTSVATASVDYIRNQLDIMLEDGTPQVPSVIMDLDKARRMTTAKIQEAEISNYPEERIDLLYGYLSWIDRFLGEAAAQAAPPPMPPQEGAPLPPQLGLPAPAPAPMMEPPLM